MRSIDTRHHRTPLTVGVLALALALALPGGVFADEGEERTGGEHGTAVTGESHEEGPGEGEEGGQRLTADGIHNEDRNGVRLILGYDSDTGLFIGSMQNVSDAPVDNARIEVHLIGGIELGPTPSIDLAPGQAVIVTLPDEGQTFDLWTTHAESGAEGHGPGHAEDSEHSGEGGEGRGEHSGEGRGEHSGEGRGEHRERG